jgi:uncharacterized protein (DUF1501 family)
MGSLITAAGADPESAMPNFVVTGMHLNPANWSYVSGPGYLGPRHAPLIVSDPTAGVANLAPTAADLDDRLALQQEMAQTFLRDRPSPAGTAHQTVYQRAAQLMRSSQARAFDLTQEPAATRAAYGECAFGQGCLLARRLVEAGVPFIEVYHAPTAGGWDNHSRQRVEEVKTLAMPQLDQGMSALIRDLDERGLLPETLVIWMGEFGRTPKRNKDGGRDHYARAWTTVLLGGGVPGGAVIGRTDKLGATVEDRPVSAIDFMATICTLLGVNPNRQFHAGDRPVRMVDRGATPIAELLG